MVGRPSRISGNGWVSLPNVREDLPNVRERSRDCTRFLGVVGRPSRMSASGRESLLDVREWSEGPVGYPEVVGRTF